MEDEHEADDDPEDAAGEVEEDAGPVSGVEGGEGLGEAAEEGDPADEEDGGEGGDAGVDDGEAAEEEGEVGRR